MNIIKLLKKFIQQINGKFEYDYVGDGYKGIYVSDKESLSLNTKGNLPLYDLVYSINNGKPKKVTTMESNQDFRLQMTSPKNEDNNQFISNIVNSFEFNDDLGNSFKLYFEPHNFNHYDI